MKSTQFTQKRLLLITTFVLAFYAENMFGLNQKAGSVEFSSNSTTRRISHARELLGSSYNNSPVRKSTGVVSVTRFVYNIVQDSMPAKYRKDSAEVSATILAESAKYGFDPLFVVAVIQTESSFNPTMIGGVGEIGLMQIRPETAAWIIQKLDLPMKGKNPLKNPANNVRIGVAYMNYLRGSFGGAAYRYVAAYNMGPTNVKRLIAAATPPREYATRVMTNYDMIYRKLIRTDVAAL
ncbi:MAG: lytic transglycosylase domain-containing protein [Bdellovibrionaceae bacterium]|nr:lytic transglycosylase domain-containing protein [Pseudobdellovibrionaceae bacterium]